MTIEKTFFFHHLTNDSLKLPNHKTFPRLPICPAALVLWSSEGIPVGISEKGWVIACSGRWYTDLVFLIQSNI